MSTTTTTTTETDTVEELMYAELVTTAAAIATARRGCQEGAAAAVSDAILAGLTSGIAAMRALNAVGAIPDVGAMHDLIFAAYHAVKFGGGSGPLWDSATQTLADVQERVAAI